METSTSDIVLVIALLVGFALFGLGMLAVALRAGPKRGTWNQPAARLRAPGRFTFRSMYAIAALHVIAGIVLAVAVPGGGIAILLVLVASACFYVLCAHSFALATGLQRRVARR